MRSFWILLVLLLVACGAPREEAAISDASSSLGGTNNTIANTNRHGHAGSNRSASSFTGGNSAGRC